MAAERASGVGSSSARRRRERQLCSWRRHEQRSIAAALVSASHHSAQGGERLVSHNAPRGQKNTRAGGRRPGVLEEPEPPNVVDRVLRRTVDQLADAAPMVQVLDTPVPQMVEQLLEVVRRLDIEVPTQVIEVPKISQDFIQERLVDCDLRHPQKAEQLLEVPTVLSLALLQQQYAEQTLTIQLLVVAGVVEVLPGEGSSASSSHSPGAVDEAGQGFFSHFFPMLKKFDSTSALGVGTASALELMDVGSLCLADGSGEGGAEEAGARGGC